MRTRWWRKLSDCSQRAAASSLRFGVSGSMPPAPALDVTAVDNFFAALALGKETLAVAPNGQPDALSLRHRGMATRPSQN